MKNYVVINDGNPDFEKPYSMFESSASPTKNRPRMNFKAFAQEGMERAFTTYWDEKAGRYRPVSIMADLGDFAYSWCSQFAFMAFIFFLIFVCVKLPFLSFWII